ncbi:hypothetical protein AQUCO_00600166v1 [Aquilegia coerulea]|uniref:GAG-pre-integrase domain-containing protein n=1 Tax=Aquilegia coerulea TaxID=218851 RepID=A0A2G5EN98_AQUCA|nr:hypothetical protein AQUCO_00600166v1 [Aquilegia coerulea]
MHESYESYFGKGVWKLTKGSLIVARGKACGTLYKTQMEVCNGGSLNTMQDNSSPNLWHRRLAHMSEKGLHFLTKKQLIPYNKGIALNPCEHCLFGKYHRVAFCKSSERKFGLLDLVY